MSHSCTRFSLKGKQSLLYLSLYERNSRNIVQHTFQEMWKHLLVFFQAKLDLHFTTSRNNSCVIAAQRTRYGNSDRKWTGGKCARQFGRILHNVSYHLSKQYCTYRHESCQHVEGSCPLHQATTTSNLRLQRKPKSEMDWCVRVMEAANKCVTSHFSFTQAQMRSPKITQRLEPIQLENVWDRTSTC